MVWRECVLGHECECWFGVYARRESLVVWIIFWAVVCVGAKVSVEKLVCLGRSVF